MKIHVLDASAMIAYLAGESGEDIVTKLLLDKSAHCYAHSINLCEVYYDALRATDTKNARTAISTLRGDGVLERRTMSRALWQRAGSLKARGNISLADCFCIALAQEISGDVVTADHREFDPLVPLGIVPIRFIR